MAIGNIDIKLGLDASDVSAGSKEIEKRLDNISKHAEQATQDMKVFKIETEKALNVAKDAHSFVTATDKYGNFINLNRQTNPYKKGGTEKFINDYYRNGKRYSAELVRDNEKILRIASSIQGVLNGYAKNTVSIVAQTRGLTREYQKQFNLLTKQVDVYRDVEGAKRLANQLQKQLNVEQQKYNQLVRDTPQYSGKGKPYRQMTESANRISQLKGQLQDLRAFIKEAKKSEDYLSGKGIFRITGDNEGLLASMSLKRARVENDISLALKRQNDAIKEQIVNQRKVYAAEKVRLRNANRLLLNNQKKIRGYRANMRGGLTDLAYGMGGAYLGERALSGMFEGVAGLQKIESQVDTWRLNKKDRLEFEGIADRLMVSNPLLNRKEALDATLAGMTSMGHFDANALKMVLPSAVHYAQGSRMLGYTDDTISNVIKNYFGVVEARQQTLDPNAMLKTFRTLWQIENVTGGKVTVKDFETILRNLGPGAPLLSEEGLLNLVAFAEQIKVAGHGGGGGAGAGISTVGNLIKMLQLTAAGKPTSINAKKMMSELYMIDENGEKVPILDVDKISQNEASGGMTFEQSMSGMKNIAQTTMQILFGSDKEIAKAGFREKAGMWSDPVRTMGAMREAFLRETQKNEENIRKYYDKSKIDENGKLKDIDILDEQKAMTSLIAQMGFQHRTTAAMSIFMNPFFLKRSAYTLESAKQQENPLEWWGQQKEKGNWNLAAQEFTTAISRLEESARPLVEIFAKITYSISEFIKQIADFNERHPMLTMFNGLALALTSIAPMVGMAAMGFARLKEFTQGFIGLNTQLALQDRLVRRSANARARVDTARETLEKAKAEKATQVAQQSMFYSSLTGNERISSPTPAPTVSPVQSTMKRSVAASRGIAYSMVAGLKNELKACGAELDSFFRAINLKLATFYKAVFKVVGKIGGLFMRMMPVVGTALLAWDFGSIVASWFADIKVTFDGETKRLGDHVEDKWKQMEASWAAHRRHAKETMEVLNAADKRQNTNEQFLDLKEAVSVFKISGDTEERLGEEYGYKTVGEVFEQARQNGWLSNDFNENLGTATTNLQKLSDALVKAEVAERDARVALEKIADVQTLKNGNIIVGQSKAFSAAEEQAKVFEAYRKTYLDVIDKLKTATYESTLFNLPGNEKPQSYNLLEFRNKLVSLTTENEEEKKQKDEELAKIDKKVIEITQQEAVAFQDLISQIRSSEDALAAFAEFVRDIVGKQLDIQGQSGLFADSVLMQSRIGNAIAATQSMSQDIWKLLYDPNIKGHNFPATKVAQLNEQGKDDKKKGAGGLGAMYYVPQNVQFANNLQAQYDESMANIRTLAAGQGKKGMDYSFAVVLQKWLNGGFSLSKKNPHESPFMKTKKGGLSVENLDLTKKDQTGRRFEDYVNLHNQAEQAKLTASAIEKLTQEAAQAAEVYEEAADLVAQGGIEKLPTAITTLDKKIAKEMNAISDVELRNMYKGIAEVAQVRTAAAELAKKTSESQQNIRAMENEARTYGMSSTQAARTNFEYEWNERRRNNDYLIKDLQAKLKSEKITAEEVGKIQQQILTQTKVFNEEYEAAQKKFLRDNQTAGQQLVQEWTDLSRRLDNIQTSMMESFLSITEDFLDDNLSSWRDYANELLKLIRREIMQATLSPLFSMISGGINMGIASLLGDDAEVQRQQDSMTKSADSAASMLMKFPGGSALVGWLKKNQEEKEYGKQEGSSLIPNDVGVDASVLEVNSEKSWFSDFTASFGETWDSIWTSTKGFFGNLYDGMNELTGGFLDLAGTPIEWLKNGLMALTNAIMNFITSLSASSASSTASSIFGIGKTILGAFAGAMGGSSAGTSFNFDGGSGFSWSEVGTSDYGGLDYTTLWENAKGGIITPEGAIDLKRYAGGGIARSPQLALFGEGRMPEAYVPLPDGRSIPVTINGDSTSERIGGNNIVINISVDAGGSSTTTTATSSNGATGSASEQSQNASETSSDFTKLANRIKSIVRQEIVIQSRPGGLLASS